MVKYDPENMNISQCQDWLATLPARNGQRPHWRQIRAALANGMPHHEDPLRPGKVLFSQTKLAVWYGAKLEKTISADTKSKGRAAAARRAE